MDLSLAATHVVTLSVRVLRYFLTGREQNSHETQAGRGTVMLPPLTLALAGSQPKGYSQPGQLHAK